MYIGNLQAAFASPDAAPTIRTENSKTIALTVAPGQNADNPPLILGDEAALLPAPKEAVSVAFICNLCGFGCPLSADTISFSYRSGVPGKPAREACERLHKGVYYPGTWLVNGGTQLETIEMAEVHEGKQLDRTGWKGCAVYRGQLL